MRQSLRGWDFSPEDMTGDQEFLACNDAGNVFKFSLGVAATASPGQSASDPSKPNVQAPPTRTAFN